MASAVSSTLDGRLAGADPESQGTRAAPEGGDAVSRTHPYPVAVEDMAAGAVLFHPPTKTNLAALGLMRRLAVCYRTAWRLKHKLMQPMQTREAIRHPGGLAIQIDDTCLGGNVTGERPGAARRTSAPS